MFIDSIVLIWHEIISILFMSLSGQQDNVDGTLSLNGNFSLIKPYFLSILWISGGVEFWIPVTGQAHISED